MVQGTFALAGGLKLRLSGREFEERALIQTAVHNDVHHNAFVQVILERRLSTEK
jgi:hypothetical protein